MDILPTPKEVLSVIMLIFVYGVIMGIFNLALFLMSPYKAFVNTGYSMCKYEDPLLEFLPIHDSCCSWTPFNVLVIDTLINKTSLKVGDNVCYIRNMYGTQALICHRIFKVFYKGNQVYYYIKGLHPLSLKDTVPANKILGKVVDKFPRGVGAPIFLVMRLSGNAFEEFIKVNEGMYIKMLI